ncbi:polysaccharide biosynthesis/export family protein [Ferrimonas lipolytica]|uniref:Polysaccharide export protein n=1 Tax=Ferrimonas lipolytica TaxID=2724191 RepID=A0A6H1UJG5_9GAMM|nr:polysaccharide biosynthesis/export family protein [Ferrimonas lipolytica]QIZ78453.1 polysaccharide export protein [Ferrimonas lipolytica]
MTRTSSWRHSASLCKALCLAVVLLWSAPSWSNADYRLSAGDQISILVYGEDDLTLETRLGESGMINYPYLGLIKAKGMSVAELELSINRGLKGDYLINPSVHVSVTEYRPFYIYGEVNRPGGYPYQPGLTVERAVALAGGLTERASTSGIVVNRQVGTKKNTLNVRMSASVYPDDSIVIKESFF